MGANEIDRASAGLLILAHREARPDGVFQSEEAQAALRVLMSELTEGEVRLQGQVDTTNPESVARAIREAWSVGIAQAREKSLDVYTALLGNFVRFCLLLEERIPDAPIKELLEQVALEAAAREADE